MNIVDNHPATKPNYPATDAMAREDAAKLFEKTVLREFLNEDADMADTITNLTQMLAVPHHNLSMKTLTDARMALKALTNLTITMKA